METDYGHVYRERFEKHWWWRARQEVILENLHRLRPPGGWRNILDVGCGDGLFFAELLKLGSEVEGVEPAAGLITDGGGHRERIYVGPFDGDFRPGKTYQLILMLDVLEHIADPVGALRRVVELLGSDGTFLATVPAFMQLWTKHDELNHHYARYTKETFRDVAHAANLHIDHQKYFLHWTCPAKLAVRLVERMFPTPPAIPTVPPRFINEALYWLSHLEAKLLRPLNVPFGSSLLVVAHAVPE